MWSVRRLKIILSVLALIPVFTGLAGLMGVNDPIYAFEVTADMVLLDSNLRFYAGVWLALGLALFYALREIEKPNPLLQAALFCVFIGGIGRLLSMVTLGWPPLPFVFFTVLEIVGMPLLMLWQYRIAKGLGELQN